jgi:CTP synthase (UTP-ammonia lyase)
MTPLEDEISVAVRIALVGDFDPGVMAHRAIPEALQLSARRLGVKVAPEWLATDSIGPTAEQVSRHAAVWCVPGSPYANPDGALAAIRLARATLKPFLGTCGGFQHVIIEYARNVLGLTEAGHTETDPDARMPVIGRLACSLVEKSEEIVLQEGSGLRDIYLSDRATEQYHCNYGLNAQYANLFRGESGLRIAATGVGGEARAVELTDHPFFVATLFQPERSGLRGVEHPLVTSFLEAAAEANNA